MVIALCFVSALWLSQPFVARCWGFSSSPLLLLSDLGASARFAFRFRSQKSFPLIRDPWRRSYLWVEFFRRKEAQKIAQKNEGELSVIPFFAAGFFGCVSRFRPRKTPLRHFRPKFGHFRPIFVDRAEFVPIYHVAGTRGEFARCGRHFETQHPLKLYQNYEN